ncbi:MAG TPA: hypothetical protein VFA20_20715 [Myxococcaceae bacterium]|nr:hypothetical protein [Myxococcaceae bacterium]
MGTPGVSSFTALPWPAEVPEPPMPSPLLPLGIPCCCGKPARDMLETSSIFGTGGVCGGTRSRRHPATPTAASTAAPSHPRMRSLLFGT